MSTRSDNIHRLCTKCRGRLYLDKDYYGWYEQCLQCGLINDLNVIYEDRKKNDYAKPTGKSER
jgi:hypothetical protein